MYAAGHIGATAWFGDSAVILGFSHIPKSLGGMATIGEGREGFNKNIGRLR